MALHEKLKNAKIVEEITGYLLDQGYTSLEIKLEVIEKEAKFTVWVEQDAKDLVELFKKDLYCCREITLEEYGFDQLHDVECVCSLNTLGMLVDHYEIELVGNKYKIVLHRLKN